MTYKDLFTLLTSLGFREEPSAHTAPNVPRVFVHDRAQTVLLFRNTLGQMVTPADMLSAEVHLHARGIADPPLEALVDSTRVKK